MKRMVVAVAVVLALSTAAHAQQMQKVRLYSGPTLSIDAAIGVAIPSGTHGLLAAGSDGTNARLLLTDTTGALQIVCVSGCTGGGGGGTVNQGTSPWVISGAVTQSGGWTVGQSGAPWSMRLRDPSDSFYMGDGTHKLVVDVGSPTVSISGTVPVSGTFWQSTQPVSGTFWQSTQPISIASAVTVAQATAANLNATVTGTVAATQSGTWTVQQGGAPWSVSQSGTWTVAQGGAGATAWKVDGSAVTQPVSGTITANAGSGTFTVSGAVTDSTHSNITADYDTGAGTQTTTMYGLALPANGGAVAGGTSGNPVRTDPTGTTTQPVSGTFWQSTQPVSASSLPLPSGAATSAKQPALGTAGSASADVLSVQGVASMTALRVDGSGVTQPVSGTFWQATQPVSGTFWQATQPVSAASLPLPSGASTSAKQPALGTAGSASADVISIQGVASMTAVKVDGSGVTQPVSGTFWQATQPVSGTVTANAGSGTMTVSQATSGGNPCMNPASTITSIFGATSGTANVQLVAISGSTKIYLCSVNITGISGTSPTFSLVYGTGSACASGTTTMLGAWTTAANTIYTFYQPSVTAAGTALCYKDGGTSPVQNYAITYVQQ